MTSLGAGPYPSYLNNSGTHSRLPSPFLEATSPSTHNCDSGLRLNRPDEQKLLLRIKAQYPNLKKDIEDLSFLMWHLLTCGVLPPQRLLLETLNELEIKEMSQKSYQELLTFVDSPVPADVNGALEWPNCLHGNDFFSEDPALLLQTAEQSAAEQQSAVAGSDSMRQLDEFVEECIDPAVLGPNAATPYVGAKM